MKVQQGYQQTLIALLFFVGLATPLAIAFAWLPTDTRPVLDLARVGTEYLKLLANFVLAIAAFFLANFRERHEARRKTAKAVSSCQHLFSELKNVMNNLAALSWGDYSASDSDAEKLVAQRNEARSLAHIAAHKCNSFVEMLILNQEILIPESFPLLGRMSSYVETYSACGPNLNGGQMARLQEIASTIRATPDIPFRQ